MSPHRKSDILLVDGDTNTRVQLARLVVGAGYSFREAGSGRIALGEIAIQKPDAVVMDPNLPDLPGGEMLGTLRRLCEAPLLVLCSSGEEQGKIEALDAGADDCMTKPVGEGELLARLRALLRRAAPSMPERSLRFGPVEIDLTRRWVTRDGRPVRLTSTEYELLQLLVVNADRVVSHRKILRELWGPAAEDRVHYVRTYMTRLRSKLGEEFERAGFLRSESGVGYRWISDPRVLEAV